MDGNPSHSLKRPQPGAANPNDTGFLPAVGGRLSAGALKSTLSNSDCSLASAKQFWAWKLMISGGPFPAITTFSR